MSPVEPVKHRLITTPNLLDADGFYDQLLDAHEGLNHDQSDALNARLILLLCNHVGDASVIGEALRIARGTAESDHPSG